MPRAVSLALAGFALAALAPANAPAGDISREWKTIESDHFVVHYYEPLGDIARRVAVVGERAHRNLAPALDNRPNEKTQVVLLDDTDGANGFASVLPRNTIRLFVSAPSGLSALADHDDWLYVLTAHEYTHILHLDTISGFPALYNKIFGKTWAPNQIQPRWVIEGIATYEESKRTSGGRTRHALFDMNLRMATLSGHERRLDEVTNGPRAWPHGTSAYLYGSHFLKYVFDRYGDDRLRELSHQYGANPIPYGLNKTMERVTGKTFVELYEEWRDWRRSKYSLQEEAIARDGRREGRRLTFSGEANFNPTYTPDGEWIVWLRSDGVSRRKFAAMPAGGHVGKLRTWAVLERAGGFDVLSDGSMVVEQTQTTGGGEYNYQELVLWDKETGETTQLTSGARARDPDLSPDESMVAFTMGGHSQRFLAVMPLRVEAEPSVVWKGKGRFDQVYSPTWSPDGERIAFTAWREGGHKDILIVDLESGEVQELAHDRAQDSDPVFSPDGDYLYYSSDRSGVYNIYAYELATGKTYQVTNVLGAALVPQVSPDGERLVYQGYGYAGYDLYEIRLDPASWTEAEIYVNDRTDPVKIRNDEVDVSEPRPYRPLETLAPRAYTLELAAGNQGLASINATTSGSDVAGHHRYNLSASVALEDGDVSVGGSYSYNRLWPSLRIAAVRNARDRGGIRIDGQNTIFTEERFGLTARVGLPVLRDPDARGTLSLDYDVDVFRNTEDELEEQDPNDLVPSFPETDAVTAGLALRFGYSDTRGYVHTLGPQEGKSFNVGLRFDHPRLGSDFETLNLSYSASAFRQLPWGVTPVLMMRLAGGIRTSNRESSPRFSLGGAPNQDVVGSVLNNVRAGVTGRLRGYEDRSIRGTQFHLLNLEYRQELLNLERGFATLPFYLRRLHFAALFDAGDAFDGPIEPEDFKASLGASLRMDMVFGYFVPGALDVGYSRGLTGEGIDEFWVLLTGTL